MFRKKKVSTASLSWNPPCLDLRRAMLKMGISKSNCEEKKNQAATPRMLPFKQWMKEIPLNFCQDFSAGRESHTASKMNYDVKISDLASHK
jgi:hypothetical protein